MSKRLPSHTSRCRRPLRFLIWLAFQGVVTPALAQSQVPGGPWGPMRCPPDENPQFFAPSIFGSNPAFSAECYSWYLRSIGEHPLTGSVPQERAEVYRAVVLPAHSSPVVVRLTFEAGASGELVGKVGKSAMNPEILAVIKTSPVSPMEINSFVRLLNEANFWSMPTVEPWDPNDRKTPQFRVMGGTDWMLEGVQAGRHHVVTRVPSKGTPYKDLIVFLVVRLAKIDLRALPTQPPDR